MAACPRCNHHIASVRYDYGAEKILKCQACRLLYLHPWPAPEETRAVYGETYFENAAFLRGGNHSLFGYADYVAERMNKQPQFAKIAREVRSLLVPLGRTPRLLEIGCGFGYFLDEAFEEGFSVAGLEFNPQAVARLERKYAFPIQSGSVEEAALERGSFDAVAMFDVIEHLRDPFHSLDKIYDALTPGGLIAISTLDAESIVSRVIGKRLEDFRRTREHLIFFSRTTLRDVLDEHGFDVLAIRSVGHTFDLAFLLDRLALYNRPLFSWLRRLAQRLGLGSLQLHVNPRTKMIAIGRRRAERRPAASNGAAWNDLDRTLFEELQRLEAHNQRHYRWVFDVIAPYLGLSVLEVGSGIGVISQFLLTRCESLILSDYREIFLDELRRRFGDVPHVQFRLLDLDSRPYDVGNAEPDTVICMNVLEHIEDDGAALRALAAVLRPGGRLILQVPNYPRLFGTLDRSYGHFRRYTSRQLRTTVDRAGFRVVALRNFGPFAIPGWVLSGRVLRSSRLSPRALVAYDGLVPIMRAFDFLSRLGGVSLIAVAERKV